MAVFGAFKADFESIFAQILNFPIEKNSFYHNQRHYLRPKNAKNLWFCG